MCKSKNEETSDGMKQTNTNVCLLNMSKNSTTVGVSEILEIIMLIILIWIVVLQKEAETKWKKGKKTRRSDSESGSKTISTNNGTSSSTSTTSTIGHVNSSSHIWEPREPGGVHEDKWGKLYWIWQVQIMITSSKNGMYTIGMECDLIGFKMFLLNDNNF